MKKHETQTFNPKEHLTFLKTDEGEIRYTELVLNNVPVRVNGFQVYIPDLYLSADTLRRWFYEAFPNGKIVLNRLDCIEQREVFEATLYEHKEAEKGIANGYGECPIYKKEEQIYGCCATATSKAISNAMKNLGFGLDLFDDDDLRDYPAYIRYEKETGQASIAYLGMTVNELLEKYDCFQADVVIEGASNNIPNGKGENETLKKNDKDSDEAKQDSLAKEKDSSAKGKEEKKKAAKQKGRPAEKVSEEKEIDDEEEKEIKKNSEPTKDNKNGAILNFLNEKKNKKEADSEPLQKKEDTDEDINENTSDAPSVEAEQNDSDNTGEDEAVEMARDMIFEITDKNKIGTLPKLKKFIGKPLREMEEDAEGKKFLKALTGSAGRNLVDEEIYNAVSLLVK